MRLALTWIGRHLRAVPLAFEVEVALPQTG
jgi:hypothetical protein